MNFEREASYDEEYYIEMNEGYREYLKQDDICTSGIINAVAISQMLEEFGDQVLDDSTNDSFIEGFITGKAFMLRLLRRQILESQPKNIEVEEGDIHFSIMSDSSLSIEVNGKPYKHLAVVE